MLGAVLAPYWNLLQSRRCFELAGRAPYRADLGTVHGGCARTAYFSRATWIRAVGASMIVVVVIVVAHQRSAFGAGRAGKVKLAITCGFAATFVLLVSIIPESVAIAPRRFWRRLNTTLVVSATAFVWAYPFYLHYLDAKEASYCDDNHDLFHLRQSYGMRGWFTARVFYTFAIATLAAAIPAACCVLAEHPPSAYARSAIRCVVIVWLYLMLSSLHIVAVWCADPRVLRGPLRFVDAFVVGFLNLVLIVISLWVLLLVLRRVAALEASLSLNFHTRCMCFLLGAATLLPMIGMVIFQASAGRSGGLTLLLGALKWLPFGITVALAVKAFTVAMEPLMEESDKVGRAGAEARWAMRVLRQECLATVSTSVMSFVASAGLLIAYKLGWRFDSDKVFFGLVLTRVLDLVVTAYAVAVLSGALQSRCPALDAAPPRVKATGRLRRGGSGGTFSNQDDREEWVRKVEHLAQRGFTLHDLLNFYARLGVEVMPHYNALRSTTSDVVRHAIIPLSKLGGNTGGCSLAEVWSGGHGKAAQRMVTHNWSNLFCHLAAAIIADGLELEFYGEVAAALVEGRLVEFRNRLQACGSLDVTYWVCAFSVNQHAGICGDLGAPRPPPDASVQFVQAWERARRDSVTGEVYPVCACKQPKYLNDTPIPCEMNKFDDMMVHLSVLVSGFMQVVAVDQDFQLFDRAWCVAELVEADSLELRQAVKVISSQVVDLHFERLEKLDVENCKASRPEDVQQILDKIVDVKIFNERLQWLIFGTHGLFASWRDARAVVAEAGRIASRALTRQLSAASASIKKSTSDVFWEEDA